jgi:hypothetical protein
MNRARLTAIAFLLSTTFLRAQTPDWVWARGAGSTGTDNAFSITAHQSGSTYVTGHYGSGGITLGTTTLANLGASDIFIAKYDSSGAVLWAHGAGGPGYEGGQSVATDSAGNCYVTGGFEGSISFGTVTLTTSGFADVFVVKYDPNGNLLWARNAGSSTIDVGSSIAVDGLGNCYVTGYYSGSMTIGASSLPNAGNEDIFIAKYDASGSLLWAKGFGGTFKDVSTGVAADSAGKCTSPAITRVGACFLAAVLPLLTPAVLMCTWPALTQPATRSGHAMRAAQA